MEQHRESFLHPHDVDRDGFRHSSVAYAYAVPYAIAITYAYAVAYAYAIAYAVPFAIAITYAIPYAYAITIACRTGALCQHYGERFESLHRQRALQDH